MADSSHFRTFERQRAELATNWSKAKDLMIQPDKSNHQAMTGFTEIFIYRSGLE
jgi:hypothetical protein